MALWPFNKRRPKLRRFGKWFGVAAGVVFFTIDVLSATWGLDYLVWAEQGSAASFSIGCGRVHVMWRSRPPGKLTHQSFLCGRHGIRDRSYGFAFEHGGPRDGIKTTRCSIPLWFLTLVSFSVGGWLWWRDRPSRRRKLAEEDVANAILGNITAPPSIGE